MNQEESTGRVCATCRHGAAYPPPRVTEPPPPPKLSMWAPITSAYMASAYARLADRIWTEVERHEHKVECRLLPGFVERRRDEWCGQWEPRDSEGG